MPLDFNSWVYLFIACASSVNSTSLIPSGTTFPAVSLVTIPIIPTFTPSISLTVYGSIIGSPAFTFLPAKVISFFAITLAVIHS